ncbi:MAG: putative pyridoxal-dependent aspartate 1-decarboxylase, partial [bacterium]|nr:putative pyridoxal-dependent aspartate 1-decarboxylase [bacterium]
KINQRPLFELVSHPILNILTYRVVPEKIRIQLEIAGPDERILLNNTLDDININIQRIQREAGKSFVSRTRLKLHLSDNYNVVVLRTVIMNPMTTPEILDEILDEQELILSTLSPDIS